ncbi:MAG: hypothetical protein MJE77_20080, partial [Proteobacteria bacterium]|nr:hypothetical protein [Pseudomonadota bacterium]
GEDRQAIPGIFSPGSKAAIDIPQPQFVESVAREFEQLLALLRLLQGNRRRYGQRFNSGDADARARSGQSVEGATLRFRGLALDLATATDPYQLDVAAPRGLLPVGIDRVSG